ncbi:uncharacterized protein LOC127841014 [Dreissena polymorpha]|uniref:uncharacterized protein LOC127841014 n=1 Tax=Dreissena polymorpha TaxID=45954 RepID=UPI00226411D0|nr:uncharacterized protein LOC127841014 [Dreissena polymorpha]
MEDQVSCLVNTSLCLPFITTKCHQCAGPIQICEQIHFSKPCLYPNNYCINHITNHLDGTKTVNRTCGNFDTCYRKWHLGSSDEDKCDVIKTTNTWTSSVPSAVPKTTAMYLSDLLRTACTSPE